MISLYYVECEKSKLICSIKPLFPPCGLLFEIILILLQSLLLQELRQSTLDEIFTLLEPYMKLAEKLSREMAITILHATLKTFLENRFPLNESDPIAFSPGRTKMQIQYVLCST